MENAVKELIKIFVNVLIMVLIFSAVTIISYQLIKFSVVMILYLVFYSAFGIIIL